MKVKCIFVGHRAPREEVWNRGYAFSKCRGCGCDIIRSDAAWSPVPKGHRVVWKRGYHDHSLAANYRSNLPVLYRGDVRAPDPIYGGWHRQLLLLASAAGGESPASAFTAPGARDCEKDDRHSWLLAAAVVAGAGLGALRQTSRNRPCR